MEIQQVSSRTGLFRGTWITNTAYNYGDFVQDGINGLNSLNYYLCIQSNTSGVWTTDLANGCWQLIIPSTIPITPLPLSIANGGTGEATAATALSNLGGISLAANNTFTGANNFTSGSIAVPTANPGDSSSKAASTAFVAADFAPFVSPNFSTSARLNSHPLLTQINVQKFTSSGTYTPTTGTVYAFVEVQAAGGSSGNPGNPGVGSGGGAGGYSKHLYGNPTSQTVTIGAAGSNTTFGSIITCTSGGNGSGTVGSGSSVVGGTGGSATGGNILNLAGQAGGIAPGGSPAWGGRGGNSPLGTGGPETNVSVGINATGFGAGGGGPINSATVGVGAPAIVIVTEWISA